MKDATLRVMIEAVDGPKRIPVDELPGQTFERVFHRKWPGGKSEIVRALLTFYEIPYPPGSAAANSALQDCLTIGTTRVPL